MTTPALRGICCLTSHLIAQWKSSQQTPPWNSFTMMLMGMTYKLLVEKMLLLSKEIQLEPPPFHWMLIIHVSQDLPTILPTACKREKSSCWDQPPPLRMLWMVSFTPSPECGLWMPMMMQPAEMGLLMNSSFQLIMKSLLTLITSMSSPSTTRAMGMCLSAPTEDSVTERRVFVSVSLDIPTITATPNQPLLFRLLLLTTIDLTFFLNPMLRAKVMK